MGSELVYDKDGFREVPGDDRGWPGFTERLLANGRTIQARGVGALVREVLARHEPVDDPR